MPKLKIKTIEGAPGVRLAYFRCPGCKGVHGPNIGATNSDYPASWTFNGDMEKPTLSPSVFVSPDDPASRCHSFVENGRIQYLGDCHHELAGQTVDLPDW